MGTKWGKAKVDVSQIYREVARWASSCPGLEALLLFGSYAHGEETPLSDVDLAYLPGEGLSPSQKEELDKEIYIHLSRLLGTDEITLIDLDKAPPILAFSAVREGKVLFCHQPELLAAFKERVLTLYPEVKRLRDEALAEFGSRLKVASGDKEIPMNINREKILYHLRLLEKDLTQLKEKAKLTKKEYLADSDAQIVVERRFQRAIESCLNIGNHLISRLGLKLAEDYASVFAILAEANIISSQVAERMVDMARFRNLLVHLYWSIDHERVYHQMGERMATLESFLQEIHKFITPEAANGE